MNGSSGLTLYNAGIREPDIVQIDIQNENELPICVKNADYIAEISGELPCRMIQPNSTNLPLSPFLRNSDKTSSILNRIDRLKEFVPNLEKWNKQKSIAFQLLSDGSIEYISKALNNRIGKYYYECDHYLKSLHCLQDVVLEEGKYLFIDIGIEEYISRVIYNLADLEKTKIIELIEKIGGSEELIYLYRKAIEVFTKFMQVYEYLLPAETYMNYIDKDTNDINISTCTFDDIKSFYQDAYESLASMLFIPVCLDNLQIRGDFNLFSDIYHNVKCYDGTRNLKWYRLLDNGTRVNKIDTNEYFQKIVNLPAKVKLRNGIGHNNFSYDGITQTVKTYNLKNKQKIEYEESLMSIAIDCLNLAKSSIIFSEIILFFMRTIYDKDGIHTIIHPDFYRKTSAYDNCPCGSGLKYKRCCEKTIEKLFKQNKNQYFK